MAASGYRVEAECLAKFILYIFCHHNSVGRVLLVILLSTLAQLGKQQSQ